MWLFRALEGISLAEREGPKKNYQFVSDEVKELLGGEWEW